MGDRNPSLSFTGQLTDVSTVEKYEISDADYEKRQGGGNTNFLSYRDE